MGYNIVKDKEARKMKKAISLIVAAAMLIGIITAANAFDSTQLIGGEPSCMVNMRLNKYFGDRTGLKTYTNAAVEVKYYPDLAGEYLYARSAVQTLANTGIFKGHTDKRFHPSWYMKENELGLVAVRLGEYITDNELPEKYAAMTGDAAVERQELVAALYDIMKSAGVEMTAGKGFGTLKGAEAIDEDKLEAYEAFVTAGIVGGDIRGNLRAAEYVNRADAAVIVCAALRYIDMLPNKA